MQTPEIQKPISDNRSYQWKDNNVIVRPEFLSIVKWVTSGASVVDLGCGNGSLLRLLKQTKNITEAGIEVAKSGVDICQANGLSNIAQGTIDRPLTEYADNQFDYAVCNVTMQMVLRPEIVLREMKRIARFQIISIPNFAFLSQRFELMFRGHMPKRLLYGYTWYSTGHIHQCSLKDIKCLIEDTGLMIVDSSFQFGKRRYLLPFGENLLSTQGLYLLKK